MASKILTALFAAVILIGFTCSGNFCFRHSDSEFTQNGDKQNFDFINLETSEILFVRWLAVELTVNIEKRPDGTTECWIFNGEEATNCL